jgi:hypothetical protein
VAPVFLARDALLVLDPLSKPWMARLHQAEAENWKRCVWLGITLIYAALNQEW